MFPPLSEAIKELRLFNILIQDESTDVIKIMINSPETLSIVKSMEDSLFRDGVDFSASYLELNSKNVRVWSLRKR